MKRFASVGMLAVAALCSAAAQAEAIYFLQAETGQLSASGPNTQQQVSGDLTQPGPLPSVSVSGNSGIRSASQSAFIGGNPFDISLNANGFLSQHVTIAPGGQFNTFAQAQVQVQLGYWVVMNNPLGAPWQNAIPILYAASSSTNIGNASDGFVSSQADFGSSFGENLQAERHCGFDGVQMVCTRGGEDFAVTGSQIVSANDPFFFFMQARGVDQAAYPNPGSSSYTTSLEFDILIDPDWEYATYFELVVLPEQPGGGNDVPAPGALALLALGFLGFALRRRAA